MNEVIIARKTLQMQNVSIYLAGYGQDNTIETLKKRAIELNALVVDVRYCPVSKRPEFRRNALKITLADRYIWLGNHWGAERPTASVIKILDFECGLRAMKAKFENPSECECFPTAAILLCSCRALSGCHRGLIGKLLQQRGYKVKTFSWVKPYDMRLEI